VGPEVGVSDGAERRGRALGGDGGLRGVFVGERVGPVHNHGLARCGVLGARFGERQFGEGAERHFAFPTVHPFNVQRHLTSAQTHRALRAVAMDTWRTAVAAG
jgi:hypothetical protein